MTVRDDSGSLHARFFHGAYLEGRLKEGQRLVLHGKADVRPVPARPHGDGESADRDCERERRGAGDSTEVGRIVPIYEAIGGISSRMLRRIIYGVLRDFDGDVPDPLPDEIRERYRFPTRREALLYAHFPPQRRKHRTAEYFSEPRADAADLRGVFLLPARAGACGDCASIASTGSPCACARTKFARR